MLKHRFGYVAAAIALSVVPLAGCDQAQEKLSRAEACGDLVEMSLSELRRVREGASDPAQIEQSLRDAAQKFRDKASEIDNAEVEKAARTYARKMKKLAESAAAGETPDVNAVIKANSELAKTCT